MKFDLNTNKDNFKKYSNVKSELIADYCSEIVPVVSIMIPTYKRPHLLKETIYSAINQKTDVKFEIVIVDNDCSKEFEEELLVLIDDCKNCNIRFFRNEDNIGMFGNWNRCFELARGEWLTILNDDDLLHCDYLSFVHKYFKQERMISVAEKKFVHSREIDICNKIYSKSYSALELGAGDLYLGHFAHGVLGCLLKKDICINLGGFDDSLFPIADCFFAFRYWHQHGVTKCKEELSYFRWSENESLKLNVLRGFITTSQVMSLELSHQMYPQNKFKRTAIALANVIVRAKKLILYPSFNSEFETQKELSSLGFKYNIYVAYILRCIPFSFVRAAIKYVLD